MIKIIYVLSANININNIHNKNIYFNYEYNINIKYFIYFIVKIQTNFAKK